MKQTIFLDPPDKPGLLIALLAAAFLLAAVSPAPGAAPSSPSKTGTVGLPQSNPSEADLARWDKQLTLPPHVAARLNWARRSFAPSGYQKLEGLARTKASAIAAGKDLATMEKETASDRIFSAAGISGMDASEAAFLVLAMATKDMDDDLRMIMAEMKATNAAKQKLRDQIKDLNKWISEEMSKTAAGASSSDVSNTKVSGKPPSGTAKAQPSKVPPVRFAPLQKASSPLIRVEYVKAPAVPPLPPRGSGVSGDGLKSILDDAKGQLDGLNEMSEMTSLRLQMTMDRRSKFISTLSQIMKKSSTTQDILVQNIK
jgi:hypothetical protein